MSLSRMADRIMESWTRDVNTLRLAHTPLEKCPATITNEFRDQSFRQMDAKRKRDTSMANLNELIDAALEHNRQCARDHQSGQMVNVDAMRRDLDELEAMGCR